MAEEPRGRRADDKGRPPGHTASGGHTGGPSGEKKGSHGSSAQHPPPPAREDGRAAAEGSSEEEEDDEEVSSSEENVTWIQWFCGLKGNEFFVEVDEDYIQDDFNLTGLSSLVPSYEHALDTILDTEIDEALADEQQEMLEAAAEVLYGLIHARFVLTNRGLAAMAEKFNNVDFGRCPRFHCQGQAVLPVGCSDLPRMSTVKIFCPRCRDLYYPRLNRHANIDGAYFGTSFPHLLLQTYPDLVPSPPSQSYVPRIYGFKIHRDAIASPTPDAAPPTPISPAASGGPLKQASAAASPALSRPSTSAAPLSTPAVSSTATRQASKK